MKKAPALSGGTINTADTDYYKGDRQSPSNERVYFGEHKRREGCHGWL